MVGRSLLTVAALAIGGFLFLVLVGVWTRYEGEASALGFTSPSERYAASQAGFPNDPAGYRAELLRISQRYFAASPPQAGIAQQTTIEE